MAQESEPKPSMAQGSVPRPVAFAREPDYSQLPRLQPVSPMPAEAMAPMVLIGVGPVGHAVLERLAQWFPPSSTTGRRPLDLLAIRVSDEPRSFASLIPALLVGEEFLLPQEILRLRRPERGTAAYPWYSLKEDDDWGRPDGRLSLFQDLQREPSALWDALQARLATGQRPDVWLISSAFDAVGSGMIFDLAHLVRLVGQAQNYVPFIGWMLALPNPDWCDEYQPEAVATLRELARLQAADATRVYEYNPLSTNYTLHRHEAKGAEDVGVVMIASPSPSQSPAAASAEVVQQMALALRVLSHSGVWTDFRDQLRHSVPSFRSLTERSEAAIVGFNAVMHYLALPELRNLVRSWLVRDVLVGRPWGVMQPWRLGQPEPDEVGAAQVLQRSGHPFLVELFQVAERRERRTSGWPSHLGADQSLALALRQQMQELVDQAGADNGLKACDALLSGLSELLARSRAPEDRIKPLESVLNQARQEMRNWITLLTTVSEETERRTDQAQRAWDHLQRTAVGQNLLDGETATNIYQSLTTGANDIRGKIRSYVRWAWIAEETGLRLRLDTLFPPGESDWRHKPEPAKASQLWEAVLRVVETLTAEAAYWPTSLSAAGAATESKTRALSLPSDLTNMYNTDKARNICTIMNVGYQVSGDRSWLENNWLPKDLALSALSKFAVHDPTSGLALHLQFPMPLSSLKTWPQLSAQYDRRRHQAHRLHIFEPEQWAAAAEARASRPYQARAGQPSLWLSARVVSALQWQTEAILFLRAWSAGLVKPAMGQGRYRLMAPRSVSSRTLQEAFARECDHPVEAMLGFVASRPSAALINMITDYLQANAARLSQVVTERREAIARWRESTDQRNREWYVLIHGLKE